MGQHLGDALHGPDILFVTEGAEKALPQGLFPAGVPGAMLQFAGFALKTNQRGLPQQIVPLFREQLCQRGGTSAAQTFRPALGGAAQGPQLHLVQGHIEEFFQRQGGCRGGGGGAAGPNDVQNHLGKGRIAVVLMRLPVLRQHIDLDVARTGSVLAELQERPAKIRSGLVIPKAGMQHANGLAVEGAEEVAAEALVMPDILQQAFGRLRRMALAQKAAGLLLRAPLGVKLWADTGHGP